MKRSTTRLIKAEYSKAVKKHPKFPDKDIVHIVGVMAEEAGEALQAAMNTYYHGGDIEKVKTELLQTGAMVYRSYEKIEELLK